VPRNEIGSRGFLEDDKKQINGQMSMTTTRVMTTMKAMMTMTCFQMLLYVLTIQLLTATTESTKLRSIGSRRSGQRRYHQHHWESTMVSLAFREFVNSFYMISVRGWLHTFPYQLNETRFSGHNVLATAIRILSTHLVSPSYVFFS
jgi:hypothetical protein